MSDWSRRAFVGMSMSSGWALAAIEGHTRWRAQPPTGALPGWLPQLDPAVVQETVALSHRDLAGVRALVERRPALANAAVDWGFGDWEDALGAAAHTGRREIAELLLAHGARLSLFAATMLGQLDVVKAIVSASPGIQRTLGPHGIPLLAHARAGGLAAEPVVTFLEAVGGADVRTPTQPLEPADRDAVVGRYSFGAASGEWFDVDVQNNQLAITRSGGSRRNLFHSGALVFFPVGAPNVRIAFARTGGKVTAMTIADPEVYVTATRV